MAISIHYALPLNAGTKVKQVDLFIGNGVTTAFLVTNKSITDVAGTIQYSSTQKTQRNGGFIKSASNSAVIIDTPPPSGVQGVIPASTGLTSSVYDQTSVLGVSEPRVQENSFFLTVDDPQDFDYIPRGNSTGIALSFVDNITGSGADISWVQLACSNNGGSALAYLSTGAALFTPSFNAWGYLASSTVVGASSVMITTASDFIVGDYVIFNIGNVTSEEIQISAKGNETLYFYSTLNYAHASGETIYTRSRKLYWKTTCPENATSGQAALMIDMSLDIVASRRQKV